MFAIPTAAIAGFAAFYFSVCSLAGQSGHGDAGHDGSAGRVRMAGGARQPASPAAPHAEAQGLMKYARGSLSRLVVTREPRVLPEDAGFVDAKGERHTLSDWKGRVALVNVWATWCGPCKLEMPSLDRLQAKMGGPQFAVLAVSVNRGGAAGPQAFFQKHKISNLEALNDKTGDFLSKVKARGLPVTLLLDREGREIARVLGPAKWDSEEAVSLIREAIGR
jgi:thiol-disulfide isomerase/thioredoxin